MVDLSTVASALSVMVAAISVVIGVTMGVRQVRNWVRTRETQLFMGLYETFRDREFQKQYCEIIFQHEWRDFDDWLEKYGPTTNIETFSSWVSVPAYFEGIGVLLKRKLIDIGLVDDILSTQILLLWEKMEPIIKAYRKHIERPQLYEWFEYLYNEMKKREEQPALASK